MFLENFYGTGRSESQIKNIKYGPQKIPGTSLAQSVIGPFNREGNLGKLNTKIKFITALALQFLCTAAFANTEDSMLPFSGKNLVYPEFEQDQKVISDYLKSNCKVDPEKLDIYIKQDYLIACQFPSLLKELRTQVSQLNELLASGELILRENAQFLDLEYGWLKQDAFSLVSRPEINIVNILLLRRAVQKSISSLSKLWYKHHGRSAQQALFYTLPKFAAAMERDLLLTRMLHYTHAINCVDLTDFQSVCLKKRAELRKALNTTLKQYQSINVGHTIETDEYLGKSIAFRAEFLEFVKTNNPIEILNAVQTSSSSLQSMMEKYRAVLRLPKILENIETIQTIERFNIARYLHEQKEIPSLRIEHHEPKTIVSPGIVSILTKITKQMDKFFPN